MSNHVNDVWLVGAGGMAAEYTKVLAALGCRTTVIGRSREKVARFAGVDGVAAVADGGIAVHLQRTDERPTAAIVATPVETLAEVTGRLIAAGVRRILVEKPGALDVAELERLETAAARGGGDVRIAYNRRFYAATSRAREIIAEDGGVRSFAFEFTEWSHEIVKLPIVPAVKERWLVANSSHVIDLAFFLGGAPRQLSTFVDGALPWHRAGAIFAGAGVSERGALFSYHANWAAPGRWGVEVLTARRRLIFRPMEKLSVMQLGSVKIDEEPIDDRLDREFKPGLYKQTEAFLAGDDARLPTLGEQRRHFAFYDRMLTTS
jgi:predicted dehydrogenase